MAGQGSRIRSAWAMRRANLISTDSLRKQVASPTNTGGVVVWPDWWFESGTGPTYYGILKRWTGAAWVKAKLLVRVGGAWVAKPLKRWTGAAWVEVDATGA